jgi:hypothetical protein
MIGFIHTFYTQLGTTGNYSAIIHLRNLQFTVTHALGFSVFTSRILATDLSVSVLLQIASGPWPTLKYYPGICMEGLIKTTIHVRLSRAAASQEWFRYGLGRFPRVPAV